MPTLVDECWAAVPLCLVSHDVTVLPVHDTTVWSKPIEESNTDVTFQILMCQASTNTRWRVDNDHVVNGTD